MPNSITPEPYFFRWQSILVLKPRPGAPKIETVPGIPFYQHLTCHGIVPVTETRVPPKICPNCNADCEKEARDIEIFEKHGVTINDKGNTPITPDKKIFTIPADQNPLTFGK